MQERQKVRNSCVSVCVLTLPNCVLKDGQNVINSAGMWSLSKYGDDHESYYNSSRELHESRRSKIINVNPWWCWRESQGRHERHPTAERRFSLEKSGTATSTTKDEVLSYCRRWCLQLPVNNVNNITSVCVFRKPARSFTPSSTKWMKRGTTWRAKWGRRTKRYASKLRTIHFILQSFIVLISVL